jgi:hypothetical protein
MYTLGMNRVKVRWESEMNSRMNSMGLTGTISKSDFVDMVCHIWPEAMTEANAKAGFVKTGICPMDRTKFDVELFDERLLTKYNAWKASGDPAPWDMVGDQADPQDAQAVSVSPSAPFSNVVTTASSSSSAPCVSQPSYHIYTATSSSP